MNSSNKTMVGVVGAVGVAMMLAGTSKCAAVDVALHLGSTAPASEGWLFGGGSGVTIFGEDAWSTGNDSWEVDGVFVANPSLTTLGWIWDARVAVTNTTSSTAEFDNKNAAGYLRSPGGRSIPLFVTSPHDASAGGLFTILSDTVTMIGTYPGDGFHNYRIIYNPGSADVTFAVDGSVFYTAAYTSFNASTGDFALWGLATSTGNGSHQFTSLARLSVLPEPASLSLIGLGGLFLLRRSRRA